MYLIPPPKKNQNPIFFSIVIQYKHVHFLLKLFNYLKYMKSQTNVRGWLQHMKLYKALAPIVRQKIDVNCACRDRRCSFCTFIHRTTSFCPFWTIMDRVILQHSVKPGHLQGLSGNLNFFVCRKID